MIGRQPRGPSAAQGDDQRIEAEQHERPPSRSERSQAIRYSEAGRLDPSVRLISCLGSVPSPEASRSGRTVARIRPGGIAGAGTSGSRRANNRRDQAFLNQISEPKRLPASLSPGASSEWLWREG